MASTSSAPAPAEAPWKAAFLSHVTAMQSPEFVFSSLHPIQHSQSTEPLTDGHGLEFEPRARFCIFRGFWAELPENQHNLAEKNERVFASDMPTFTTDVRMNKPFEVFASSAGRADDEAQAQGSGGGGPCEAVWWAKGQMTQWRIRGQAFVIAPDIEGEREDPESSGVRTVKSELGAMMRVVREEGRPRWSWKRELTAHFGNMAPGMRGTFAAPPPGQPVDQPFDDKNLKLGQKIDDLEHSVARKHFRVVVIKPERVESVDLSDPNASRRQVYDFNGSDGLWSHQECWP